MDKKSVLTSLAAIMVAAPVTMVVVPIAMVPSSAMAASWPSNDVMSENTSYTSAATLAHMGVADSTADAQAQAYYNIAPGYYLPANNYQADMCNAGSYCPGVNNVTKSASNSGIEACPGGYPSSDSGADGAFDCYRTTCPTTGQHLASGGSMTGRVYSGELNNCTPSQCAAGFSALNMNVDSQYRSGGTPLGFYAKNGADSAAGYVDSAGNSVNAAASPLFEGFDSTVVASYPTWAIDFGTGGYLFGGSACKGSTGARFTSQMSGTDGNNCYCWLTGYKPTADNGLHTYRTIRGVAVPVKTIANNCVDNCAKTCAAAVMDPSNSATADAVNHLYEHASNDLKCVNNPYKITYDCASTTSGSVTPAQQAVEYLTTYTTAANTCKKTGYSFSNWKVSDSSDTVNSSTKVTGDGSSGGYPYTSNKTYTANWNANTYTITLNNTANGGSPANYSIKEVYATKWTNASGQTITRISSIPSRDEHVFLGYYNDAAGTTQKIPASGTLPSGKTTFTSDAEVYAKYAKCNCSLGVGVDSCSYNSVNSNACVFTVACAYNSATAYYGAAEQMGVEAAAGYTAECTACTNKPKSNAHYTGAVTAVAPAEPTNTCPWACNDGYSLNGKKAGTTSGTDNQSSANCQAIDDYLVTYRNVPSTTDGGSCTGATYNSSTGFWTKTYKYGEGMTLCTPTKLGYSFSGWATTATGGTPQKPVTIGSTVFGDKTYYAYWSQNTINIIWGGIGSNLALAGTTDTLSRKASDGTNLPENTARSTVSYDGNINTPVEAFQQTGQVFVGWKFLLQNQ